MRNLLVRRRSLSRIATALVAIIQIGSLGCGAAGDESDCGDTAHGDDELRVRFATEVADFDSECEEETQTRTCDDGNFSEWSGTFEAATCEIRPAFACGESEHGASQNRTRYVDDIVPFGAPCSSELQMRSCYDGTWSEWNGGFVAESCSERAPADCDEGVHTEIATRTRYPTESVPFGATCTGETQERTCFDGSWSEWSGSLVIEICAPEQPATCDGAAHGTQEERTRFEEDSVRYGFTCEPELQARSCDNGVWTPWSGEFARDTCFVADPLPGSIDYGYEDRGILWLGNPDSRNHANSMFELSSGQFMVVTLPTSNEIHSLALTRLLGDGTPDTSYGPGGTFETDRISIYGGGFNPDAEDRIIRHYYYASGTININGVARLNADGRRDETFEADQFLAHVLDSQNGYPSIPLQSVRTTPSGKILSAGVARRNQDGAFEKRYLVLVRLNDDGSLDASFGVGGVKSLDVLPDEYGYVSDLLVMPDGEFFVLTGSDLWKFDSDGNIDSTFGAGGRLHFEGHFRPSGGYRKILIDHDGELVVAGLEYVRPDGMYFLIISHTDPDTGLLRAPHRVQLSANSPPFNIATDGAGNFVLVGKLVGNELVLWSTNRFGASTGFGIVHLEVEGLSGILDYAVHYSEDRTRLLLHGATTVDGHPQAVVIRIFNTVP